MAWLTINNNLGANPVEKLEHLSGDWAINFLMASLTVSPIVRIFKLGQIFFLRKILGLISFYYALFHFSVYLVFDVSLRMDLLVKDIVKRPYITAGFICLVILCSMAVTSQRSWLVVAQRSWKKIHRLVYIAAVSSVLHYIWLIKADNFKPAIYGFIVVILLLLRAGLYFQNRRLSLG
jgi:sulfoxide reductase heme-binding subunit YedZ